MALRMTKTMVLGTIPNFSLTPDGGEHLLTGNFVRVVDFGAFEVGAVVAVSFAVRQAMNVVPGPSGTIRWRIRAGGTEGLLDGDVIFMKEITSPGIIGVGDLVSDVDSFVNAYTGPKIIQLSGQTVDPVVNSASGNQPQIMFKTV